MDAPKCRLCQQRHYGLCTFAAKPDPATFVRRDKLKPEIAPVVLPDEVEGGDVEDGPLPALPEGVVCPVCEHARRRDRDRLLRHRAKKKGILE